jgi:hypothetical protein
MVSAIHARTALFWALKVDVRGSVTILCFFRSNDTSPKTNAVLKEKTLIAVRPAAPHAVPALCQMGYLAAVGTVPIYARSAFAILRPTWFERPCRGPALQMGRLMPCLYSSGFALAGDFSPRGDIVTETIVGRLEGSAEGKVHDVDLISLS